MENGAGQSINKISGHKEGMVPKRLGKVSMEEKSTSNLKGMFVLTFHHPHFVGES